MDYKQFEGAMFGPWHPIEFSGHWRVMNEPFYDAPDLLDADSVGSELAEINAKLAAASPSLLARCQELEREVARLRKENERMAYRLKNIGH